MTSRFREQVMQHVAHCFCVVMCHQEVRRLPNFAQMFPSVIDVKNALPTNPEPEPLTWTWRYRVRSNSWNTPMLSIW